MSSKSPSTSYLTGQWGYWYVRGYFFAGYYAGYYYVVPCWMSANAA